MTVTIRRPRYSGTENNGEVVEGYEQIGTDLEFVELTRAHRSATQSRYVCLGARLAERSGSNVLRVEEARSEWL
jgi:hypothetical protein